MKYLFEFLIKLNLILGAIHVPYTYASDARDIRHESKEFNRHFKKFAKHDSDFVVDVHSEFDDDYVIIEPIEQPKFSRKRKRDKTIKDLTPSLIHHDKTEKGKKHKKSDNLLTSSEFSSDYTLTVTKKSKSVVKTIKPVRKKQRTQEHEKIEQTIPKEAILASSLEAVATVPLDEQKLTSAPNDTLPEIVIDVEEYKEASLSSENASSMPTPQSLEKVRPVQGKSKKNRKDSSKSSIPSKIKSKKIISLHSSIRAPYSNGMQTTNFWPAFNGGATYPSGMYQYNPYSFMPPMNQGMPLMNQGMAPMNQGMVPMNQGMAPMNQGMVPMNPVINQSMPLMNQGVFYNPYFNPSFQQQNFFG